MLVWGYQVIKQDKNGRYVEVNKEKFYLGDTVDDTVDDVVNLINSLRQSEKLALRFEDEELIEVIRKEIEYYSTVLKEIYSDD